MSKSVLTSNQSQNETNHNSQQLKQSLYQAQQHQLMQQQHQQSIQNTYSHQRAPTGVSSQSLQPSHMQHPSHASKPSQPHHHQYSHTNQPSISTQSIHYAKKSQPVTQQTTYRQQNYTDEEEKQVAPTHHTIHSQRPLHSYEMGPLDNALNHYSNKPITVSHDHQRLNKTSHAQQQQSSNLKQKQSQQLQQPVSHKPQSSTIQQRKDQMRQESEGEHKLNKRHQMRMTSGESKQTASPHHNITRSLIDEGSEDFTNIEEHLQEDTRISCRNAVASSLNNVSILLKQGKIQQQVKHRQRRCTGQSIGISKQESKEETFESSSFFDEGVSMNRVMIHQVQGNLQTQRCNKVDGYNIPTIFNTLMFGIDQSKVSDNVRQSFSKMQGINGGKPQSRVSQHNVSSQPKQSNSNTITPKGSNTQINLNHQISKKEETKTALSQLVTKVDISNPVPIFNKNQNYDEKKQQTKQKSPRNQTKASSQNSPPTGGRQSQLSLVAQQNLKIEQHIESPEHLTTEILQENVRRNIESQKNLMTVQEINLHDDDDHLNNPETDEDGQLLSAQTEDFQSSELHRNHLIQTLQSLQYIKTLPPVNKNEIKQRQVRLPPFRNSSIKKTIIFDLDETLVHCIDDIENNPCDQIIHVTFPNGETVQAGINIRPYAIDCLIRANENYQVVVFTASHKAYADVVLDLLDPTHQLIQYRLYRDHCIRTEEGIYIKDLRIIMNRQLKDLIIVDNAVYSFGYQLDNGIPIIPFYDDKKDEELMHLIFYFNCLASCDDMREQNRKAFQLKDLQEIDIGEYLQNMMNNQANQNDEDDDE